MSNIFLTDNKTDEMLQVKDLSLRLKDYMEAYPDEQFVHEAWLTVCSKLDDLGGE